jgi:mannose-6-phosphate isomerase-like protein (cupin superfamily)
MIERIVDGDLLLAIVIRKEYKAEGIEFFTENHFSQQLGYMNRSAGYVIPPHKHREVNREVRQTQEVLIIRSGRVRVDLYRDDQQYVDSVIVRAGDVILLASGGHGFEMLEDSEIIEVKQGPYSGDEDKIRFE